MEYYIISLIISVIVFGIIQIIEYRKISYENQYDEYNENTYSLFTINNCLLFGIIYIVITIASYLLYSSNLNLNFGSYFKSKTVDTNNINQNIKEEINPEVISKIQDNFEIGLDPFNSDNSSNDSVSISSNSDSD